MTISQRKSDVLFKQNLLFYFKTNQQFKMSLLKQPNDRFDVGLNFDI